MLRYKGNMRRGKFLGLSGGSFLRWAWGREGGEWWGEGLGDFEKNIYALYPRSAYR